RRAGESPRQPDGRASDHRRRVPQAVLPRRGAREGRRAHEGGVTIRVAVADDHPLMLDALEWLFKSQPDIVLVARCTSGAEAIGALVEHRPDILLLDLKMPG